MSGPLLWFGTMESSRNRRAVRAARTAAFASLPAAAAAAGVSNVGSALLALPTRGSCSARIAAQAKNPRCVLGEAAAAHRACPPWVLRSFPRGVPQGRGAASWRLRNTPSSAAFPAFGARPVLRDGHIKRQIQLLSESGGRCVVYARVSSRGRRSGRSGGACGCVGDTERLQRRRGRDRGRVCAQQPPTETQAAAGRRGGSAIVVEHRDRYCRFGAECIEVALSAQGRKVVANAFAERWIGTLRRELLDRTIIWNRRQLNDLVVDYIDHYNTHRPHRSLDQRPPVATDAADQPDRHLQVVKTARCGGLINEYRNAA